MISNTKTGNLQFYNPGVFPKRRLYGLLILIIACIYGVSLAALPLDVFRDRLYYLKYAANSQLILERYALSGILTILSNEPLWLFMNSALSHLFSPENTVRVFIFVPAVVVSWLVLRTDLKNFFWLLLFLLMAQVVNNHIVHIRQGVAIAFFLSGWFSHKRWLHWPLMCAAPFIHAAFFFVLLLYFIVNVVKKFRFAADLRTLGVIVLGITIGVGLGWLASFVGARQASEYAFSMTNISGLGFIFWLWILVIMIFEGKQFLREYAFEVSGIVFYLSTYFLIEVTARIFESMLLLILLASLRLTGWRRQLALASLFGYFVLQYALRWHDPWLGFGISV